MSNLEYPQPNKAIQILKEQQISSLNYPISLLEDEGAKFLTALQLSGVNQVQRTHQLDGIRRAIGLLKIERRAEEIKEIKKKRESFKKIKI